MSTRVTVLMCVYNGEDRISQTIESVLAQSFDDFELLIVDDGSTDASLEIARQASGADSRIRILELNNSGLTAALIRGMEAIESEFVARIDVGDLCEKHRLQEQVAYLEHHPQVVAVGSGVYRIGPADEHLGVQTRDATPAEVTDALLTGNVSLVHPSAMFRTKTYRQTGGYRCEFRFAQDIDLWFRMTQFGMIAEIDEPLISLRIDLGGISARNTSRQSALADIARRCLTAKENGLSEEQLLGEARELCKKSDSVQSGQQKSDNDAAASYFIGCQLLELNDPGATRYFVRAARQQPTSLKYSLRMFQSILRFKIFGKSNNAPH